MIKYTFFNALITDLQHKKKTIKSVAILSSFNFMWFEFNRKDRKGYNYSKHALRPYKLVDP